MLDVRAPCGRHRPKAISHYNTYSAPCPWSPIPPAIGLHSFACLCRSLNGCCCPSPAVVGQISANLREAHKSSVHHIPSSFQGPAPFPAPRRNIKKQTDEQPPALLHQLPFHSFICILSREFVLSSSKTVRNNAATTKTAARRGSLSNFPFVVVSDSPPLLPSHPPFSLSSQLTQSALSLPHIPLLSQPTSSSIYVTQRQTIIHTPDS